MNNQFLYLYCVTGCDQEDRLPIAGLNGKGMQFLKFEDLKIWYSEIDKTEVKCSLENLKIHNRVSLDLMEKSTVIPFKFGTVVKDINDIYTLMDKLYSRINENIIKLAGKYEVGIKVFGKVNIEVNELDCSKLTAVERITSIENKMDSKGYLIDRIKMYEYEKLKERKLDELRNGLLSGLISLSDDYRILNAKSSNLLLNSAFLIKEINAKTFEEHFDSIRYSNPGYSLLFSGPWPPYNFINISIEGD